MVAVGQRKTLVKFEENQPTDLGNGRKKDQYVEFLTCWGYLRKMSGSRAFEAFQGQLKGKWECVVQWQSALENKVWKSMRIVVSSNRFFTVDSIELVEEDEKKDYRFILNETTSS